MGSLLNRSNNVHLLAFHQAQAGRNEQYRSLLRKGVVTEAEIQQAEAVQMKKGITTTTALANVTIQDIEPIAVNTQWRITDKNELTLLKLLPTVNALQVTHDVSQIDAFGPDGLTGFFAESGRPPSIGPSFAQIQILIKLMGFESDVGQLAAHQANYVQVDGSKDPTVWQDSLVQKHLWFHMNRALYFADTRTYRGGDNGNAFQGIFQQVEVGTATSPFASALGGSHVVDMLGGPFNFDQVRRGRIVTTVLFRGFNTLFMSPAVQTDFESSLDGAIRLGTATRLKWGDCPYGMRINNEDVMFLTDNTLSPEHSWPQYTTDRTDIGVPGLPVIDAVTVQADGATTDTVTSVWDANPRGADTTGIFWVITQIVNGIESLGARSHAGVTTVAVAATQEVEFTVTHATDAEKLRVYRGYNGGGTASTDAWHIFDVAASATGQTLFWGQQPLPSRVSLCVWSPDGRPQRGYAA